MRPTAESEMHPAVEEVKIEPYEFFIDVGSLVLEGRVPSRSGKGYTEGLHCPPTTSGQARHQCDPTSVVECQRYEVALKHMLMLWRNSIPMSVEVLLSPDCTHCSSMDHTGGIDISSAPDTSHLLLEQWYIQMLPRRIQEATAAPRSLIQAMRSYLHFSQISAWYSLSGGRNPRRIYYRISVPGEAFSSKFLCSPHVHNFPVSNLGRNASIKVSVKSVPRCPNGIPAIACTKHPAVPPTPTTPSEPLAPAVTATLRSRSNRDAADDGFRRNEESVAKRKPKKHSKGDLSADLLLGESLLDPPQSLQMYPKRYQSPSRSGSPSVEAPEHLLFRSRAQSPLEPSGEAQLDCNRGRAPRRPVIERFLKKSGEPLPGEVFALDAPTASPNRAQSRKEEATTPAPFWPNQQHTRVRSLVTPSQAPERQAPFVPVAPQSSLLHGAERVVANANELSEKKLPDKFARAASPDQCGLKQSFEDMSLCHITKPSAKHKLISSCSISVLHEQQPAAKPHLQRTSEPNVKSQCGGSTVTDNEVEHRTVAKEVEASGSRCGGVAAHKEEANHNKRALGHSKTWSEGLCDLKLKDGVVGKGSHIFSNLIHKHKVRQMMCKARNHPVPTAAERAQFRRSLDSATSMVFHQKTGLPLTSSPAPLRKSGASFDFDDSLTSVSAIKRALFEKEPVEEEASPGEIISSSAPASTTTSSLIVNFEESVLNGRLEPVSTVQGFVAEIGASGSFCPRHITLPVTVFFYSLHDIDKVVSPYLGHINLGMKGYHVPKTGTIQVTLFNPHNTVVKMFVVRYDLSDMPPNCQTFIRQRTLFMPTDGSETDPEASRWLRYLIHLRFASSKSGRIYLHTDVRIIVFRKSDLDAATIHGDRPYELRSFTQCPVNPKFSPCE
ncbi:protein FAM214A [Dermacentor silvarum]|uniref:protein FAM214A n=1 Tax=Dermacentor silvarum TaxID=543639 RepID=UPI001896A957|nr:protein FAM214A [Dermacentor silvarum]